MRLLCAHSIYPRLKSVAIESEICLSLWEDTPGGNMELPVDKIETCDELSDL